MKKQRIGLYGGTFNPVHLGHVEIARSALANGLNQLIVIPCSVSPHKQILSDADFSVETEHRWNMLRAAFHSMKDVQLSRYELEGPLRSYTYQTIARYQKTNPGTILVLSLGFDQLVVLDQWTRFKKWGDQVEYMVLNRKSNSSQTIPDVVKKLSIQFLKNEIPAISSTEIRDRIKKGLSITGFVPEAVADYIAKHALYQN